MTLAAAAERDQSVRSAPHGDILHCVMPPRPDTVLAEVAARIEKHGDRGRRVTKGPSRPARARSRSASPPPPPATAGPLPDPSTTSMRAYRPSGSTAGPAAPRSRPKPRGRPADRWTPPSAKRSSRLSSGRPDLSCGTRSRLYLRTTGCAHRAHGSQPPSHPQTVRFGTPWTLDRSPSMRGRTDDHSHTLGN